MKRIGLVVKCCVSLLLCFLCGCGGQQTQEELPLFWMDDFMGTTYSQQGAFYYEGGFVHFLDPQNGMDSIVCNDPACDHRGGKGSTCSAYIGALINSTVLENKHLLMVTDYGSDKMGEVSLYQTDVDGSNRKQLAVLGNMNFIEQFQVTDEHIAIAYLNPYDKNLMPLEKEQIGIYIYNREKNTGEVIWNLEGRSASICDMYYKDNAVYFWYFYYEDEYAEEQRIDQFCKVDIKTGEMTVIEEGLDNALGVCIWQDKILYLFQKGVWQYDMVTEEKKLVIEQNMMPLPCYASDWVLLQAGQEYYAYNGEKLKKIADYDKIGIMVAYPNVIYGYNYDTENGQGERVYWIFEDFLNGDITSMKPFAQ